MQNSTTRRSGAIDELLQVMAALRAPETGCPWDIEQTFATIAPYTIEEAYEVADAIGRADMIDLKEELGDLLLQVVYHARIAEEAGHFDFHDVAAGIVAKMIRRHPHVFGSVEERAAGAAPGFWQRIKAEEKAAKAAERAASGLASVTAVPSLLDDVPVALPGLTRAIKLQDKAAAVGFDWRSLAPVFDKLKEELAELEHAIASSPAPSGRLAAGVPDAATQEEFGDLLFVMANVARHLQIDPEAALRDANAKFVRRFHYIERRLADDGRVPAQSGLSEMDRLWDAAKAIDKAETR